MSLKIKRNLPLILVLFTVVTLLVFVMGDFAIIATIF